MDYVPHIFKSVKTCNSTVNNSILEAYAYPEIYFVRGLAIENLKCLCNYLFSLSDTYLT